jgi:hypothetical protein
MGVSISHFVILLLLLLSLLCHIHIIEAQDTQAPPQCRRCVQEPQYAWCPNSIPMSNDADGLCLVDPNACPLPPIRNVTGCASM